MIDYITFESEKVQSEARVLKLNKENNEGMRDKLAKVDWENTIKGTTVHRQWTAFKELLHSL